MLVAISMVSQSIVANFLYFSHAMDMNAPNHRPLQSPDQRLDLRILATTDLHMHILAYDYFADRPAGGIGLSRAAVVIEEMRAQQPNNLLFDNGDCLQGNPMGDVLAEQGKLMAQRPHPAVLAMNALRYDAITLGNHDFNFGLDFLNRSLRGARFPVVASNLRLHRPLPVCSQALLHRDFRDHAGALRRLRVGVLGFLPPQTVEWEPALRQQIAVQDIVTAARTGIAALKAQGADLIIALAHSGIGAADPGPMAENAATALAQLPGIDAIVAGHTHRVFPSASHPAGPLIDPTRGSLAGKPAVMPGFWGSHLGVIDLQLHSQGDRWTVAGFACRAHPVTAPTGHPLVAAPVLDAHRHTLRHLRRRIGRTERPLSSYLSLIGNDPALRLVTMAQRWHARRALRGTRWQDMPILSAAAPFRAGGRSGPDHYTDVPAGRLTLRSIADLYMFPNRLCALQLTGNEVREWLERAASLFLTVCPGQPDQPLIDPDFPTYNFDIVDGVTWQIDLSAPARYQPDGRLRDEKARRVRHLAFRGAPLRADQPFILVTNSYRLSRHGLFAPLIADRPVLLDSTTRTREVLRRYVARRRKIAPSPDIGWSFAPMPGTSVLFPTGPGVLPHLESDRRRLEPAGMDENGFLQLRLHL
ncbi:bifunctional 2',3'-cyclic-nucleotide 2'-phosphodiesterase/3'-nucleotidase [Paracoccus sp. SMMA_5]|uniref:bifunctional 2',3'-cyclic-nucleotide 2'-phosphodiesterase/3'-nucleotidase n=2 Tax=unclassified Paracoccus (in: a-proteobacteria) TaxID=2688777 RepID=UPI003FA39110